MSVNFSVLCHHGFVVLPGRKIQWGCHWLKNLSFLRKIWTRKDKKLVSIGSISFGSVNGILFGLTIMSGQVISMLARDVDDEIYWYQNENSVTNIRIKFYSPWKDGVSIPKMLRIKLNRENLDGGICFWPRQGSTDRLDNDFYRLNISLLILGSGPDKILGPTWTTTLAQYSTCSNHAHWWLRF